MNQRTEYFNFDTKENKRKKKNYAMLFHLNILPSLLFLFLVTISFAGEQTLSLSTQNLKSSFPNPQLAIKKTPTANPKTHSLIAFLPKLMRISETPAIENKNALTNTLGSETLKDQNPAAQHTNANNAKSESFFFLLLLPFCFGGATIRVRMEGSGRFGGVMWPRAISAARELKGSGRILRFMATMDASWRILRLDG
ncbi:hypothetical protein AAHE18_09G095600 [Arachis hypogaea]